MGLSVAASGHGSNFAPPTRSVAAGGQAGRVSPAGSSTRGIGAIVFTRCTVRAWLGLRTLLFAVIASRIRRADQPMASESVSQRRQPSGPALTGPDPGRV